MPSALVMAIRNPDLRRKILFTLGLILLYILGLALPSPGVDYKAIHECLEQSGNNGGVYQLINLFSGGSMLKLSVFAVGIMPYITASIIVQLLTVVIPRFEQLRQEGQSGQNTMTQYTRYLAVGLGVLQATGMVALARNGVLLRNCANPILRDPSIFHMIVLVLVMTAGGAIAMWFGEQITERGIGNGMSLLIFAGIANRVPGMGHDLLQQKGGLLFALILLAVLAVIIAVIFVEQGQRRIPVQYAKRMVGRRMYGGTSTYLPLKVNQAGVIPVIFASSLLYLPQLVVQLTGNHQSWWRDDIERYISNPADWVYMLIYFVLIVFFTFFYVAITFNPEERADEMKKYGGFIPGIRPGKPTADYLQYVLSRITLPGSLYLGIVAILPNLLANVGHTTALQSFAFGGTTVLILVSVGLDTVKAIQSQLMQHNYEGFLK